MKRSQYIGMIATVAALFAPVLPAQATSLVATKINAQTISGTGWQTVSDTTINVNIPSSRLVIARFTAESACYGSGSGNWCSVRIVARRGSTEIEFDPVVGTDYAFDSTDNGTETGNPWEGHAVNRSKRLSSGQYQILVQARTTSNSTTIRLDDAHFEVEY